jgi:hypothetical protein
MFSAMSSFQKRNTRREQMFSAVPPAADIRHGISKTWRSTLQIPACVMVDAKAAAEDGEAQTTISSWHWTRQ